VRVPLSKFVTHELRFTSDYESTFQWQFGGTYYDNKLSDFNEVIALPPTPSPGLRFRSELHEKRTTAYGAFAEATWSFLPDTRLTLGLRYDHTEVQVDESYTSLTLQTQSISGPAGFREFDNTTYKARLEHDLTESNLIYGMVSTGFSPGDIALGTDASFTPEVVELDAEVLTAYEVGSKNRFLDNRLQVNGALYYNDYSAYQLANVNFGTPVVQRFTSIALPLTSRGAELEILALPWTAGTFGLNLSYTDSKFDLEGIETAGDKEFAQNRFYTDRVYGVPKFRGSLSYDHRFEFNGNIALLLHGDVVYNSEYDTQRITVDEANTGYVPYVNQGAQTVGNLSGTLQLADGRYGITGYVRNVTDEEYKTEGNGPSIFSPAGSATLAAPRTWGVILRANF
jgi:outer membrane receptor protein involved in Fe transport